ncbi:alpha/beta hydrolase [Roseovarius sp. CAU 1744]|uniref:alpha/beta hydrolase n=1 Tax=Roseovarius sp. CAU 1744 TaxID=3140368 RepID=UPI00325A8E81
MTLHPDMSRHLGAMQDAASLEEMTLDELRASFRPVPIADRATVGSVEDMITNIGTPMRCYRPDRRRNEKLIVFFHGGGYVAGDLESHDHVCRDLVNTSGSAVIAVNYRRSPEYRFPVPVDDCFAAVNWIWRHLPRIDSAADRLVVVGDSAGATLATAVCLRLQGKPTPKVCGQVLAYPITDYHTPPTRSYLENAEGYGLTRGAMLRFWSEYIEDPAQARHPWASPLGAATLAGLPPALVMTAEYDPLRDEGDAYATRLKQAGVPVTHTRYQGLIHGFLRLSPYSPVARDALTAIGDWINTV